MTPRGRRLAMLTTAALLPAALGAAQWLHSPSVLASGARRKLEATRQRWQASLQPAASEGTYAAIALGSGTNAWAELLVAAGIPAPVQLPPAADLDLGSSPYRLLIVSDDAAHGPGQAEDAALVLARPGRAVVTVPALEQMSPGPSLRGSVARWNGLTLPIVGTRGRSLEPSEKEIPMLVSDAGEILALRHPTEGGVVIRFGIDLASLLMRVRGGHFAATNDCPDALTRPLGPGVHDDWADRPWADELIEALLEQIDGALPCPLPRTSGLPGGRPTVVLTADQDVANGDLVLHMSNRLQARDAGATFLLAPPGPGAAELALPAETATELLANGHGVGVRPLSRDPSDLPRIATAIAAIAEMPPLVSRIHARWPADAWVPQLESEARLLIDLGPSPQCSGHEPCAAFVGGSTRPVRIIAADGRVLPLLQQPIAVDDISLRAPDLQVVREASAALGGRALHMLQRAAAVDGPLVVSAHPSLFAVADEWLSQLIDSRANVISAEAWVDFVARRRQSRIVSLGCSVPPSAQLQPGISLRPAGR